MRLHLVDGTYELFRAHFSRRPPHARRRPGPEGHRGLASSMLALLDDPRETVSHVAIAFDNPIRSVRNEWFEGYKTEEGVPPELLDQFDLAEDAARALGMVVWRMGPYEADDALATGAARWRDQFEQVRVMTPDKDLGQSIVGQRVVLVDRLRDRVIDEGELLRARGIRPSSVPDWLALVGDTADGLSRTRRVRREDRLRTAREVRAPRGHPGRPAALADPDPADRASRRHAGARHERGAALSQARDADRGRAARGDGR